jgi:hypothetical protein
VVYGILPLIRLAAYGNFGPGIGRIRHARASLLELLDATRSGGSSHTLPLLTLLCSLIKEKLRQRFSRPCIPYHPLIHSHHLDTGLQLDLTASHGLIAPHLLDSHL